MSVNKVLLLGRLGQDPALHEGDKTYCRFSMATDDGWGDKKETSWHNCVAFGKTATAIGHYLKKGQDIFVEGRVSYGTYKDKPTTSIIVESFSFVGRKSADPDDQRTQTDDDLGF